MNSTDIFYSESGKLLASKKLKIPEKCPKPQ
jgi:hypothetical protein